MQAMVDDLRQQEADRERRGKRLHAASEAMLSALQRVLQNATFDGASATWKLSSSCDGWIVDARRAVAMAEHGIHQHTRACYDEDPGPGHGHPYLICDRTEGGPDCD
jgi:hypothetical protein